VDGADLIAIHIQMLHQVLAVDGVVIFQVANQVMLTVMLIYGTGVKLIQIQTKQIVDRAELIAIHWKMFIQLLAVKVLVLFQVV